MAPHDTGMLVAGILNAAYMVRHYARGGRVSPESRMAELRREAIRKMGFTVRDALNASEDFESLLTAVVDGLAARDDWPRF